MLHLMRRMVHRQCVLLCYHHGTTPARMQLHQLLQPATDALLSDDVAFICSMNPFYGAHNRFLLKNIQQDFGFNSGSVELPHCLKLASVLDADAGSASLQVCCCRTEPRVCVSHLEPPDHLSPTLHRHQLVNRNGVAHRVIQVRCTTHEVTHAHRRAARRDMC
jgi:hypothetical protein